MAATTAAFEAEILATATAVGDPVNMATNPTAELGLTGYSGAISGTRATVARVSGVAGASGAFSVRATSIQDGSFGVYYSEFTNIITPGVVYTAMITILGYSAPGRTFGVGIDWKDSAGVFVSGASDLRTVTLGQRVYVSAPAPAGAARPTVTCVSDSGAKTGETLDVDAVMIVAGSYAGSYFDGSTPGFAWTGAAHASTSRPTQVNYVFGGTQRGLMAGAAYKLRQAYLAGITDPAAHTLAKNHPKQLKALTDNAKLTSFDAITAP